MKIGDKFIGVDFSDDELGYGLKYNEDMDAYVGATGVVKEIDIDGTFLVIFEDSMAWWYPTELFKEVATAVEVSVQGYAVVNTATNKTVNLTIVRDDARKSLRRHKKRAIARGESARNFKLVKLQAEKFIR